VEEEEAHFVSCINWTWHKVTGFLTLVPQVSCGTSTGYIIRYLLRYRPKSLSY